jgi:mannose-6-phosphate isomerase-like protein (cupin superfamily)
MSIRKVETKKIEKGWGYELVIVNDHERGYCGKILVFHVAGNKGSMHYHLDKHEHFFCSNGKFHIHCINPKDASRFTLEIGPNDTVVIPQGQPHQIECIEVGELYEFSTPDSPEDSYRVEKGDSQTRGIK